MISLREILEVMHSGEYFSLKCVTHDEHRADRCGNVLFIERAKLVWATDKAQKPKSVTERAPTALERSMMGDQGKKKANPHHQVHATRNVRQYVGDLPTEDIRKIHIRLIVEFNGQPTTP